MESIEKSKFIDEICHTLKTNFFLSQEWEQLFNYEGVLDRALISLISEDLEAILEKKEEDYLMIRRMFSVMMEGLEDIFFHGGLNDNGKRLGHIFVKNQFHSYELSFGHVISMDQIDTLSKIISAFNAMDKEELRKTYLRIMKGAIPVKEYESGLISLLLKSNAKMKHQFISINKDKTYFERSILLAPRQLVD